MANNILTAAKKAKNDEFYTQYSDIQKEIQAYVDYKPDAFKGKTVLLPCDDPEWSNFTKFFAQNFERYGLKKLISTSYASESKNYKDGYQVTLFEQNAEQFEHDKTKIKGKIFTLTRDVSGDGKIDIEDLEWNYLEGDGDFRSEEVKKLRDEADIIITNPPFSLFREFISWIFEVEKQCLVIGNINAIKYSEVFPFIRDKKLWLGATNFNKGMYFYVPADFKYSSTYKFEREKDGKKINRVPGVCWFGNLDHGKRHSPLSLMTEDEVIKFVSKKPFRKYDNFDAIEVPLVKLIPNDYGGIMGVPITFLDKYSPEQFEIVGLSMRDGFGLESHKKYDNYKEIRQDGTYTGSSGKKTNGNPMLKGKPEKGNYYIDKDGNCAYSLYDRLFIIHKSN
ncbi:DNA methyltransferase [Maribacter algarum]|uniref:DNA methyltransferase n=1 Tax=Maribacter algarum (ex Zhang et al. 2020) TaxID=2578118 RepID=A0A5S3PUU6_9FLAO|nr:adenine-specific methyltransferase EcoRI family protein [Maribacter algarum]TMM58781.1 DNA methyltransferase [Maribacter algarum]